MRKILAFTSIRSDYDLMSPLYSLLDSDNTIDFSIIVSGAHLAENSGYSVREIEKDGFNIAYRIENLLASDSRTARVKGAGTLLQELPSIVDRLNPDVIIYAGDREDVIVYAMVGAFLGIPTCHFYSGDHVPDGYVDNPIRHATSKLSSAHFVALEEHKTRLICMGESHRRIFNIGSIAIDRFVNFKPLESKQLSQYFKIDKIYEKFALVIFHPITSELDHVEEIFQSILESVENNGLQAFVSFPNVDLGNSKIRSLIESYRSNPNFIFYKNLPRDIFISLYKKSNLIIGNSSSGIYEAASLNIPAINVGERQRGRYADSNVVFCHSDRQSIEEAFTKIQEPAFVEMLKNVTNSYGIGSSAKKAYLYLKTLNLKELVEKREDPLRERE